METTKGIEALKSLPFREVVLKEESAINILTIKTRKAFANNLVSLLNSLDPNNPNNNSIRNNLLQLKNQMDLDPAKVVPPGGYSFSPENLQYVYNEYGTMTFKEVIKIFIEQIFPQFLEQNNESMRLGGTSCLGYLLDLLGIIDPQIADFDSGVKIIIDVIKNSRYKQFNSFLLGTIIDDALHLRGTEKMPLELLIGIKDVEDFKTSFLRYANEKEKKLFELGLNITYSDLHLTTTHFSIN